MTSGISPEIIRIMLKSHENDFFALFINLKMPTIVGILKFVNRQNDIF